MIFKLNMPNDYGSEADSESAFLAAYVEGWRGDADAANRMYGPIADAAKAAGLRYVRETDYGAEWTGTPEQFAACCAALPKWARRYASAVED